MRATEFINEEINPDIRDPRFSHTQQIGDYTYTAVLEPDRFHKADLFVIRCFDGDKRIGLVKFYTTLGDSLSSAITVVDPEYQQKGIASTMYAYARMLGNTIEPSKTQLPPGKKMWKSWKKSGDAKHLMKEDANTTTIAQLYNGNYPDRDETFWDYVSPSEFNTPLTVQTLARHKVLITLLGQYRAEHIDEITDRLDDEQQEIVQSYINDPALASKIIVVADDRIIDGNHRALAAAIKGVPINYVDLADLEETDEIDEGWKDWAAGAAMGAAALGASPEAIAKKPVAKPAIYAPAAKAVAKPAIYAPAAKAVAKPAPAKDQPEQSYNILSNNTNTELIMQKAAKAAGMKGSELAQFLAQTKHESWDFSRLKEKPKSKDYFARKYDPVYAPITAKKLGNIKPGDGAKFHGRGFIQLTGRDNYRMAGTALNLPLLDKPELAARPDIAAKIALWYWKTRVKPYVTNFNDTEAVTKAINPALMGLDDRESNFIDYKRIL